MRQLPDRLLVVTDRHLSINPLPEQVALTLAGGARWIWLRDRDLPRDERRQLAFQMRELTSYYGAALTIGSDVDLAHETSADGVHLSGASGVAKARPKLGPSRLLGVSCHTLFDISAAVEAEADYVTLSPIFASASKPGYGPTLGTAALKKATELAISLIALGGVTPEAAGSCISAGAAGVAVMGSFMSCPQPALLIQKLRGGLTPLSAEVRTRSRGCQVGN